MKKESTYWYSASTGGFGLNAWGVKKRLSDAVDISDEEHAKLFPPDAPQREIEAGPDGKPRWRIANKEEKLQGAILAVNREAERRILNIASLERQMNMIRAGKGSDPIFEQIDAVRAACSIIKQDLHDSAEPDDIAIADHPAWPEKE